MDQSSIVATGKWRLVDSGIAWTHQDANVTAEEAAKKAAAAAAASAAGIIDRIREPLGLKHLDTTPTSTYLWRISSTIETDGELAAVYVSRRSNYDNLTEILWHGTRNQRESLEEERDKKNHLDLVAA